MADGLLNKASIILTPTGYKAGTLYNVAPVVEPYEDFDFARASVASRVNSSGLVEMVGRTLGSELVTDGDFPTPNINWSVVTGWSVSGGSANYDDTINGQLSQAISLNSGTYKLNFNISNSSGSGARIWIGNAIGNTSYTDNTYEYYTNGDYSIYINVPSNQTTLAFWGNTGGSSFSIDNVSLKEIIDTNNIPRISYDSNGENGHILLEPTTTNLYLNTDTLSTQNVSTSASDYSVSFYGTGTITFSGSYSGSLVGTGVNDRVSLTFTATSGTLTSTVSGSVTNAQIENLGYSTSYMPSLSTQGVRATETATGAGSADLINSTEGVLYAEIAALRQVNDNLQFLAINSSSYTQNSIYIQLRSATNQIAVWAYSNGSNEVAEIITLTDVTAFNKIAIRWKVNDFNVFINGTSVFTDTSYNAPTSNSLNTLEFARGGSLNIYCKCKALAVFNEALSDDELNNLTG